MANVTGDPHVGLFMLRTLWMLMNLFLKWIQFTIATFVKTFLKRKMNLKSTENVQVCEKYISKKCDRGEEDCWYKHISDSISSHKQNQDFHEAPSNHPPPEQMKKMLEVIDRLCLKVETMDSLCLKVETMEKRFKELMN